MLKQATQLTCTKVPSMVDQHSSKVLLRLYLLQRQMSQSLGGLSLDTGNSCKRTPAVADFWRIIGKGILLEIVKDDWIGDWKTSNRFHASSACEPPYRKPARMIRSVTTGRKGFSIFRGYIWYDTDSDVCLSSSMLRFGLADAPTPLDLALHLYSPKRQRINKFSQNRLFRVGMGEPLNVICRGLDGTPRGGGGARGA